MTKIRHTGFGRTARMGWAIVPVQSLLLLAFAMPVLLVGCGDDDNPSNAGNGSGDSTDVSIGRGTIDSLLGVYYPEAFSNRDSAWFEMMLDDRYTFEKLPAPCLNAEDRICDRDELLPIIGRMFRGTPNPDGISVESISMGMSMGSTIASSDPDQPNDEDWFDVMTIVDLTIVVNNPQSTEDPITNFVIGSNQEFVVTEDKDSPSDWVIVKQKDGERINRAGEPEPSAIEESSWSDLLTLFQWSNRTVSRGSIESLLTAGFPNAYSLGDCVGYELMLDDHYTFLALPADPDKPVIEFWDKTEEMRVASRMFGGISNDNDQSVLSITLNINVGSVTPSSATDEPVDEDWFDVTTIVDLTIVVNNPHNTDDPITNFLIDSDQNFVVAADPDSPDDWVIVKQEDQERIGRAAGTAATEESSWSEIKDLFR